MWLGALEKQFPGLWSEKAHTTRFRPEQGGTSSGVQQRTARADLGEALAQPAWPH